MKRMIIALCMVMFIIVGCKDKVDSIFERISGEIKKNGDDTGIIIDKLKFTKDNGLIEIRDVHMGSARPQDPAENMKYTMEIAKKTSLFVAQSGYIARLNGGVKFNYPITVIIKDKIRPTTAGRCEEIWQGRNELSDAEIVRLLIKNDN